MRRFLILANLVAAAWVPWLASARADELKVTQLTAVRCPIDGAPDYDWVVIGPGGKFHEFVTNGSDRSIFFEARGEWRVVVCTAAGRQFRVRIEGGEAVKPDDPRPPPDDGDGGAVPVDEFGNVGRLAAREASKLVDAARTKVKATAEIYKQAAERLADGRFPSAGAASAWLAVERGKVWGESAGAWSAWMTAITVSFKKHITDNPDATKFTVAKFYGALAAGLEAVK